MTDSASNAAPPTDQPYPDPARLDATDQTDHDQEPRDTMRPDQDARGRHRPDPQTDSTEWWLRGAVARDPEPIRHPADSPGYPDPAASARLYEQLYDEAPTQYSAAVLLGDTAGFPVVPPPHPAPLEPQEPQEAAQSPAPRAPEPLAPEPPTPEPLTPEPLAPEPLTFAREPWAPVLPPPVPFAPSGPVADDTELPPGVDARSLADLTDPTRRRPSPASRHRRRRADRTRDGYDGSTQDLTTHDLYVMDLATPPAPGGTDLASPAPGGTDLSSPAPGGTDLSSPVAPPAFDPTSGQTSDPAAGLAADPNADSGDSLADGPVGGQAAEPAGDTAAPATVPLEPAGTATPTTATPQTATPQTANLVPADQGPQAGTGLPGTDFDDILPATRPAADAGIGGLFGAGEPDGDRTGEPVRDGSADTGKVPVTACATGAQATGDPAPARTGDPAPARTAADRPAGPPAELGTSEVGGSEARPSWPTKPMRIGRSGAGYRTSGPKPYRRAKPQRRPLVGLLATVLIALLAAFFAWVTAEPFWIAVGHSTSGTATVTGCTGSGLSRRCHAVFTDGSGHTVADPVALIGAARADEHPDATVRARMVGPGGGAAYVDGHAGLRFGWLVGTVLVLLCGLLLGWANGATRLSTRRARIIGYLVSLAAPLLLLIGMVTIAW